MARLVRARSNPMTLIAGALAAGLGGCGGDAGLALLLCGWALSRRRRRLGVNG